MYVTKLEGFAFKCLRQIHDPQRFLKQINIADVNYTQITNIIKQTHGLINYQRHINYNKQTGQ